MKRGEGMGNNQMKVKGFGNEPDVKQENERLEYRNTNSSKLNFKQILNSSEKIEMKNNYDTKIAKRENENSFVHNEIIGLILIDEDYLVVSFNSLSQNIIQSLCGKILKHNTNFLNCLQSEITNQWLELLKASAEKGFVTKQVNWIDLEKKDRQLLVNITAVTGNDGLINGYSIGLQDETQKIELQKSVAHGEERFKSVLSNITDIITVVDATGKILYDSPSVERILGYKVEELIGTNIIDLLHPDDKAYIIENFTQGLLTPGKGPMVRYRYKKADDTYVIMESQGNNQLHNPAVLGVVISSRDITQQLESEEQIRKSFARIRQTFEDIPIGYVLHKLNGDVIELNKEAYKIFGFNKILDPGNLNIERDIFSNSNSYKEWMQLLKFNKRLIDQKIIIRNTSGEAMITNVNLSLIESEDGEEIVQAIFTDVTNDQSSKRLIDHTLKLYEFADGHSAEELLNNGVDLAESLLNSEMAFLHEMDAKGLAVKKTIWSTRVKNAVKNIEILSAYPLKNAGIWLECLTAQKPVRFNNYITEADKKGMPKGYVPVERILAVPISEAGRVKAIAVVANKKFVYNDLDTEQLSAFAHVWWANVERKRQQEQEQFNRQLLTLSQKLAKLGTWSFNLKTGKLSWTDELYNIFELEKEQFGQNHPDFISRIKEEDRQRVQAVSLKAQQDGEPFEVKYNIKTPSGEEKIIQEYGYTEKDQSGKVIRLYGIATDVTQQYYDNLRRELAGQISIIINSELHITNTFQKLVEHLTIFGKFDFGESWMVTEDKKRLKRIADYAPTEKGNIFKKESEYLEEFNIGEGLPGLVLNNKKIIVLEELSAPTFLRYRAANHAGLKTALGIPIIQDNDVTGVLLFGTDKQRKNILYFERIINEIIGFIGSEIKRKILQDELNQWFNTLPDIISVAGMDGYFKRINPAATEILGYSNEELISTPWINFVHPNDRSITVAEAERLNNGYKTYKFQNRYITKAGKIVWLDWTSAPDAERDILYAVAKDITREKNLQELLDSIAVLAKIGGWEYDFVNQSTYGSSNFEELYGGEIPLGNGIQDFAALFCEEDQDNVLKNLNEAITAGAQIDFEARLVTKNNDLHWVRVIGKAEFARSRCTRLYGSVQDIHKKMQTELSLRMSYQTLSDYKKALDQSANIILTDADGYIIEVNDQTCKLSGFSREELIGQHTRINKSGEHSEEFYQNMWKEITNGNIWRGDLHNKRKDGSSYWVDTIIIPMKNEKGEIHQYLAIRNDITEKRKQLEAIQKQNEKLKEIAWTQSHIVRAPLARLLGLIQLTIHEQNQSLEELLKYRDLIKASAEELDEVVRKIVERASQIELG